nr:NFX1-type zinc finger-containing protein 1-like [Caretta caretta]
MALSREFVLIQGPPGTGKTFFGLQIVELLLRNQSQWWEDQRPFLVVCYTNHALDQFMEVTYCRKRHPRGAVHPISATSCHEVPG